MATERTLDEEREYLEGLLNTRFNYFALLLGALAAALLAEKSLATPRAQALLVGGALAASAMTLIIRRTAGLVTIVLEMITGARDRDGNKPPKFAAPADESAPEHPYAVAFAALENKGLLSINANRVITVSSLLVTLGLIAAAAASLGGAFR
jgi:hypothetical protein